jgi:uncharacterized protein
MSAARRIAEQWAELLTMTPHPEGGWYRETYRSQGSIPADALAPVFDGERSFCTSILFLLTADSFSAFHRIKSDELWHFHTGDAIVVHEIADDGSYTRHVLGSDPLAGQHFQCAVRAGSWFASEVVEGGSFGLVGCTVAPGFDFRDFELARKEALCGLFPQHGALITRLTRQ